MSWTSPLEPSQKSCPIGGAIEHNEFIPMDIMGDPRLIQIHCFEMLIAPVHELIFSKRNKLSGTSSIDGSLVILGHGLCGFGQLVR
jgi:hypothetical protein